MTSVTNVANKGIGQHTAKSSNSEFDEDKFIQGKLKRNLKFWREIIKPSYFILNMIQSGYKIPFHTTPDPYYFDNRSSALRRKSFVEFQIRELLENGCISEVPDCPEFINPLNVAVQPSGKEPLILDLSHLNNFIVKTHVKYEDLKTVLQLLKKGDYVFSFDLKSAYHNVDIFEEHRKYLSFCWQFSDGTIRYFHFNVLPFGLSPAPQVFTKLMRQLIKYWRTKAIRVVIYIDDGIGGAGTFENAVIVSQQVKSDLVGCGFTLNKTSVWTPTQQLTWLGHILNFNKGIIAITEEKINKLKQSIRFALSVNRIKVRELASIVGQIIAMSFAVGSWARLMTRSMFFCISQKKNWSSTVVLNQDAQNELNFWLAKVDQYNG